MANLALRDADRIRIVESLQQLTLPTFEAITAGQLVRIDPTTGKFRLGNGTTTTEGRIYGVAAYTKAAGENLTAIRKGVLDGYDLDSQDYDDALFASDTDGTIGDVAGTVSVSVGRVIPVFDNFIGDSPNKLVEIEINS